MSPIKHFLELLKYTASENSLISEKKPVVLFFFFYTFVMTVILYPERRAEVRYSTFQFFHHTTDTIVWVLTE